MGGPFVSSSLPITLGKLVCEALLVYEPRTFAHIFESVRQSVHKKVSGLQIDLILEHDSELEFFSNTKEVVTETAVKEALTRLVNDNIVCKLDTGYVLKHLAL